MCCYGSVWLVVSGLGSQVTDPIFKFHLRKPSALFCCSVRDYVCTSAKYLGVTPKYLADVSC